MPRRRWSTRRHPYTATGPARAIVTSTATATATGTHGLTEHGQLLDGIPAAPSPPWRCSRYATLAPCRGELGRRNLSTLRQEDVGLAGLAGGLLARRWPS